MPYSVDGSISWCVGARPPRSRDCINVDTSAHSRSCVSINSTSAGTPDTAPVMRAHNDPSSSCPSSSSSCRTSVFHHSACRYDISPPSSRKNTGTPSRPESLQIVTALSATTNAALTNRSIAPARRARLNARISASGSGVLANHRPLTNTRVSCDADAADCRSGSTSRYATSTSALAELAPSQASTCARGTRPLMAASTDSDLCAPMLLSGVSSGSMIAYCDPCSMRGSTSLDVSSMGSTTLRSCHR